MPRTVDLRTYLTLETVLIRRLVRDWEAKSHPILDAITQACREKNWAKARTLVPELDLTEVGTENQEWIKFLLRSCAIFGAGLVAKGNPTFVQTGSFDSTLNQVVQNLLMYLEHSATAQVQKDVLQLIAEDEAQSRVAKREYDYGTVHFNLPTNSPAYAAIAAARDQIADKDLVGHGKEQEPHITIRYGLESDAIHELQKFVAQQTPFEVSLGPVQVFPPSASSDGTATVVVAVIAPELYTLHKDVEQYGDFAEKTFPDYIPHITLAYVKPETAKKYQKLDVDGDFTVNALTIIPKSGKRVYVPFGSSQKVERNPYHDKEGKFTSKDKAVDLFHGTNHSVVDQILSEGLKAQSRSFATEHGIFATPDRAIALGFAAQKSIDGMWKEFEKGGFDAIKNKEVAVFKVSSSLFKRRMDSPNEYEEYRSVEDVPPSSIQEVEYYRVDDVAESKAPGEVSLREDFEKALPTRVVIKKADSSGRFVTSFVSFDKQGQDNLRMIASLNTSRLATWGFTAEADVRGVTRYKLNAVLDGRTSKFCRMINGKVFEVADARQKVLEVLHVQNPEDLKTVQPWPKQTKANLAALSQLTPAELTQRGLHIPPFHPGCRTMCQAVHDEKMLPPQPAETSIPQQTVTIETMKELGIDATQEQVDHWNDHVGLSPVDVVSKLSNRSPRELLTAKLKSALKFAANGDINISARGVMGDVRYAVGTVLDPYSGTYYLSQGDFMTGDIAPQATALRTVLNAMIEVGQGAGMQSIATAVAGNAFAYAKLGFLPDAFSWQTIRATALDVLDGELKGSFNQLPADQQLLVRHILMDMDEHALAALVELPFELDGESIGERLLQGVSGTFLLDLSDPLVVEQAKEYLA